MSTDDRQLVVHRATVTSVEAVVGVKRHGGKSRPIRRTWMNVECSCGAHIGTALDYIDARRAWVAHMKAVGAVLSAENALPAPAPGQAGAASEGPSYAVGTPIPRPELNALRAIARITGDGWPVSVRELGEALGLASSQSAHQLIMALEERGLIQTNPRHTSRRGGWKPTAAGAAMLRPS